MEFFCGDGDDIMGIWCGWESIHGDHWRIQGDPFAPPTAGSFAQVGGQWEFYITAGKPEAVMECIFILWQTC